MPLKTARWRWSVAAKVYSPPISGANGKSIFCLVTTPLAPNEYWYGSACASLKPDRVYVASATYTLSGLRDAQALPYQYSLGANGVVTRQKIDFPLAPDMGGEYTLAATDQRHRAVFNGIWDVGYGFQLSGLYFYGSGKRFSTSYGGDLRNVGESNNGAIGTPITPRLRPDGTIVPRNNLVGHPIHRVDLRVQRHFKLAGRAGVDGL